jgi:hypothetical protein
MLAVAVVVMPHLVVLEALAVLVEVVLVLTELRQEILQPLIQVAVVVVNQAIHLLAATVVLVLLLFVIQAPSKALVVQ